jgi:exonuclease III
VLNLYGYETHLKISASIRGTAILARSELHLTSITTLPSGRAIAAIYKGIQLINVYAPSGTTKRNDREKFFSVELTYLLHADHKKN